MFSPLDSEEQFVKRTKIACSDSIVRVRVIADDDFDLTWIKYIFSNHVVISAIKEGFLGKDTLL